jgi:serine/threonine protein kinase
LGPNKNPEDTLPPYEVAPELGAGAVFDNNYQIIATLGRGALGVVYKAKQLTLNRTVALKLVYKHLTGLDVVINAFKREAHTIAEVKHSNIVEVYGFGIADGQAYLVSEYVEGISLESLLERKRTIIKENAVPILSQVCDALTHAHEHGVIHGDLKPSNILMVGADKKSVKLMDFGIAQGLSLSGLDVRNLNETESIAGTVAYTSPEQCQGKAPDARSDIYSLACIIYEIICGKPPFTESPYQIVQDHINTPPKKTADMENKFGAVTLWALEKDPNKRPQTAEEFKQALISPEQFEEKIKSSSAQQASYTTEPHTFKWVVSAAAVVLILIVCSALILQSQPFKKSEDELLNQELKQADSNAVVDLINKAESVDKKAASSLAAKIVKSPQFKTWSLIKQIELLDLSFDVFAKDGNEKGALLNANALYADLVQQGASIDESGKKPDKQWQDRFEKICNYLLAHERSRYAWHQIFFLNEIAREERNRGFVDFLESNDAKMSFMALRARASLQEGTEGIRAYGRAGDIYASAADYCWLHGMTQKYEEFMQQTALVCKKYKVPAEVSLHTFRARKYLSLNQNEQAAQELKLAKQLGVDMALDGPPYEKLQQSLQSQLDRR